MTPDEKKVNDETDNDHFIVAFNRQRDRNFEINRAHGFEDDFNFGEKIALRDGFVAEKDAAEQGNQDWMRLRHELKNPWQRLFAVEYTNYCPIEFDHFVSHPDRYQARGRK